MNITNKKPGIVIQTILTLTVTYLLCSVFLRWTSFEIRHIIALLAFVALWGVFIFFYEIYYAAALLVSFLGTLNFLSLTPNTHTIKIGLGSNLLGITFNISFQPYSFLLLLLVVILFREKILNTLIRLYRY